MLRFSEYKSLNESVKLLPSSSKMTKLSEFYEEVGNYLMKEIIGKNVPIKIKLVKKAKFVGQVKFKEGMKSFTVMINLSSGLPMQIMYLAHELIHIKQWVNGELGISGRNITWMGDIYEVSPDTLDGGDSFEKYRNLPWEKEAFESQKDWLNKVKVKFSKYTYPGTDIELF